MGHRGRGPKRKRRAAVTRRDAMRGTDRKAIADAWEMFDDGEISTERLIAMVSDYTGADVDEICEAMAAEA